MVYRVGVFSMLALLVLGAAHVKAEEGVSGAQRCAQLALFFF